MEGVLAISRRFSFPSSFRLVLIRLLEETDTEDGNNGVVNKFGQGRYKYRITDAGFIDTVLINADKLLRPVVFVVDGCRLRQSYGPFKLFNELD